MIEERRPAVLRHAAEDAEAEVRLLFLPLREVTRLADRLLLRGVADAARVEQETVARRLVSHDAVAAGAQHRRDSFAVTLVHLTPIGFEMNAVQIRDGCN